MKRIGKIFAILATALLIFSVISIFALAEDANPAAATQTEKSPINPGHFLFYDKSEGTFDVCPNSDFDSIFLKMRSGDAITLLSDIEVTRSTSWAPMENLGANYIDFNGYRFSAQATSKNHYFIVPAQNSNLYMYSSDDTYKSRIFASATDSSGAETSLTFVNIRNSNVNVHLGDAAGVPVFDYDKGSDTWSLSQETVDANGDNIEFYGSSLFNSYYSNTEPQNSTLNIKGGAYYSVFGAPFINNYSGVDVRVNDAKIFCYEDCFIDFPVANADANVTVKNSLIYSTGTVMNTAYETEADAANGVKASNILFEDCSLVCSSVINALQKGTPEFKNCRYANATYNDGINELVKTNENETITAKSAALLASSFKVTESTLPIAYATRSAAADKCVEVTWISMGNEKTENWYKGEGIYPVATDIPNSTDICAYNYFPAIKPTSETGNITYTLKPHINFTLLANIELYADFTYNLYIPKTAADSENFNWARIDSLKADGTVNETGAASRVKGGTVLELEIANGVKKDHYLLTQPISVFEGDNEYQLVINVNDGLGGTFEHVQKFSIFDYAERVNAGNYTDEAKALVNSTKTYIKAARNFATEEGGTLPYPKSTNTDLSDVLGKASSAKKADLSEAMQKVFYGATLSLDESIKFSFYMKQGFTDTVTFHYPVNTKYKSVTVTADMCTADTIYNPDEEQYVGTLRYDISMRAIDLRGRIVIDISSTDTKEDYSYRLSNYVSEIKEQPENTRLLIDSLWAYSIATYNYLKVADSDSPTITINVGGNTVTEDTYAIVATDPDGKAAAALHDAILAKTGENLEISATEVSGKKSIYLTLTDPNRTYDFVAYVSGDDLVINCGFKSFIDNATASFVEKNITAKTTDINFASSFSEALYTGNIYYSDFGACGVNMEAVRNLGSAYANIENWHGDVLANIKAQSLLTNDFHNIKAAHNHANATQRHTVCADDSAVYYIGETGTEISSYSLITIKTPTNWGNANFIIDDTFIPGTKTNQNVKLYNQRKNVFSIESTYSMLTITDSTVLSRIAAAGINPDTEKIDLGLGYPAMIIPYNSRHKVFRRCGESSGHAGSDMHEVILIDENGNVSPDTPIMFDYTSIDYINVYRTDIAPMTVEGGTFTTVVPIDETVKYGGSGDYISRGMLINRSNITVKDVKHHIIGEPTYGSTQGVCPYRGFFAAESAANVLIEDCVLQAKRYYAIQGTYDFSANMVAGITLKGCTQRNFWVNSQGQPVKEDTDGAMLSMTDRRCWGIGGTDYCKNMVYKDSILSRFDAHAGLYNGKIINSTITGTELTGWGDMIFDNVTWYAPSNIASRNSIISLRSDYGSTWTGTITLKDVDMYHYEDESNNYEKGNAIPGALIYHTYQNWYFGYEAHFPNLIIDNVEYYSMLTGELLSAEDRGAVDFAIDSITGTTATSSFLTEPNLHLPTTSVTPPIYYNVDTDNDGKIDGTNFAYNASIGKYYTNSGANNNLNPIVPPEFIKILNNNQGYDFLSKIDEYKKTTTFFDNTSIIVIEPSEDLSHVKDEDSPLVPYN